MIASDEENVSSTRTRTHPINSKNGRKMLKKHQDNEEENEGDENQDDEEDPLESISNYDILREDAWDQILQIFEKNCVVHIVGMISHKDQQHLLKKARMIVIYAYRLLIFL